MSLKPEDKELPISLLYSTPIVEEDTKKVAYVWRLYFFWYVPEYLNELEERQNVYEEETRKKTEELTALVTVLKEEQHTHNQEIQKTIQTRKDDVQTLKDNVNADINTLENKQNQTKKELIKFSVDVVKDIRILNDNQHKIQDSFNALKDIYGKQIITIAQSADENRETITEL